MWKPWEWGIVSNQQAIANARAGATECAHRRIEAAEVELFFAARYPEPSPSRHPA